MDFINELKDGYSTLRVTRNQRKETEVFPEVLSEMKRKKETTTFSKVLSFAVPMILTPTIAFADTFGDIHGTVMAIFDGAVVLIIIFAGASWALGHRSKAIELLIGVCCGYLLARHAIDIRDYLKSIG